MSIITDSKYESASYFCIWYYQNRRGLIKKKDATLVQAKEIYLDLFEDFTEDERVELRSEINLLLRTMTASIDLKNSGFLSATRFKKY